MTGMSGMNSGEERTAPDKGSTFLGGFMRRKSIDEMMAEFESGELRRSLGALNLVLLGIGCIIGTGIFVLTGRAAAEFAGPGIVISFIITGTLCAFVALCYAELASMLPVSGSAYSYTYASMGEFAAWIMGLLLVLEYGLAASTVAVGWSGYVVSFLDGAGIHMPTALTAAPGTDLVAANGEHIFALVNLPAIIGICAVTALLVLGVQESATANNIIVFIKVSVVIAFIAIGAFFVHPANWSPFIPDEIALAPDGSLLPPVAETRGFLEQLGDAFIAIFTGDNSHRYGVGGVIHAAAVIFFAYIGFEAVSTAGAESKNPARDMPVGIIGSLVICTILYILTAGVLVGIVPYAQLDNPAPIAVAVNQIGLPWFAGLIKIGAIAGLSSVMLVLCYGQTRIFYTMSRDGLLPDIFSAVHSKFRTPWINTLVVGLLASAGAGFLSLDALAELTNVGTLAAFMLVCVTVIYLRLAEPQMKRPFRAPLGFATPIFGSLLCFILLMSLMTNPHTRGFFLLYLAGGLLLYILFGVRNSKLARSKAEAPPL